MSTPKNKLWVGYNELWRCGVNHEDILPDDVQQDIVRQGYWVDRTSQTAVILALKGCELLNRDPDSWIGISSVLGKSILGPKCSGQ